MKTTHLFTAALVLSLGSATTAFAGSSALPQVFLTAIALGDNTAGPQSTVDDLLKRARQALDEGNLEIADSFIHRAEEQNPKYGPFHMGDTPTKARADWEKKRAAKAAPNQRPSSMFAPGGGKPDAAKKSDGSTVEKNPFAGRAPSRDAAPPAAPWNQTGAPQSSTPQTAASAAAPPVVMPTASAAAPAVAMPTTPAAFPGATAALPIAPPAPPAVPLAGDVHFPKGPDAGNPPAFDPAANVALPASKSSWNNNATETPAGRAVTMQPPTEAGGNIQWPKKHDESARTSEADPKAKSDELLRTARKALAVGDARRANTLLEQAKQLKAEYAPLDNEPIKVENLIRKHNELTQSRSSQPADAYKRQQSDLLLEQAQGLLRLGEVEEAERLANDCQRLGLKYAPHETKPSGILDQVATARNQGRPASTISFNNFPAPVPAGGEPPAGLAALPNVKSDAQSNLVARQEVQKVLGEARAALAQGNLARAEQLVRQADSWRIADTAYGPEDDRPGFVRLEIEQVKQGNSVAVAPAPAVAAAGPNRVVLATYGEPALLDKGPAPLPSEAEPKYPTSRAVFDPAKDTTRNQQASGFDAAGMPTEAGPKYLSKQAFFDPAKDTTRNQQASGFDAAGMPINANVRTTSASLPLPPEPNEKVGAGQRFFQQGEEALKAGDAEQALKYFRQANGYKTELDPLQRQQLQDQLQVLTSQTAKKTGGESLLPTTAASQQVLTKQISADVARKEADARTLKDKGEPKKAMDTLTKLRASLEQSELQQKDKDILIRRVDTSIRELTKYIEENRSQIELDQNNKEVLSDIDRAKKVKLETQAKLAKLVEEFNKLQHEQRFDEAVVVAKKAVELAPNELVATQLLYQGQQAKRHALDMENIALKEDAIVKEFQSVDAAARPFQGPIQYPNIRDWNQLTVNRKKLQNEGRRRSPKDIEIERHLTTPISCKFQDRPLEEVIKHIGQMAQVNIHHDPQGLSAEGAQSSDPVTIDLTFDISVESALKLILTPKHLSYVIKNEVLLITSEHLRDNNLTTVNYPAADLIIPSPNFVPNGNLGMGDALNKGYGRAAVGRAAVSGMMGMGGSAMGGPVPVIAANGAGDNGIAQVPGVPLKQNLRAGGPAGPSTGGPGGPGGKVLGNGPGGLGGGTQADFESLIELITTTVRPTSWDTVGGPGSIKGFEGTLSLVVSQTQEVHDEIADLLKQLRRLQDLQVTIEVRFITLSDSFFERIGFDFEFDLKDKSGLTPGGIQLANPNVTNVPTILGLNNSALTIGGLGAQPYNNFSPTNNIQFRQGSFGDAGASPVATVPFTTNPASFGFAILSDIEAYFLVQAAQGDTRSNILQAPKVTLFNGQQAFVSDTTQRPFVAGVVPVVGDFAAAQQPIIIVLSEGTSLTVQAVVSNDRRFVRLTVVPFFSNIGDVQTFTFEGTSSTTKAASATQDATSGNLTSGSNNNVTTNQGTTVQLPTFSFVTVTTTVSVPDGGTVLLGGIKRLNEGRNESGIPLLSKLPYINRLFKNTAIARSTTSLMMMVTPRIIIQEEEEDKLLGGNSAANQ